MVCQSCLQGEMLSAEHANFFSETYAALVHTMLVPLLEHGFRVPSNIGYPSKGEEDTILTAMIASLNASMKAGEQVSTFEHRIAHNRGFFGLYLLLVHKDLSASLVPCGPLQVCFLVPSVVQALVLEAKALDTPRQVGCGLPLPFHCATLDMRVAPQPNPQLEIVLPISSVLLSLAEPVSAAPQGMAAQLTVVFLGPAGRVCQAYASSRWGSWGLWPCNGPVVPSAAHAEVSSLVQ